MLPLRLCRVAGFEGRMNDVLYQPASRPPPSGGQQTLVFFGGDVQDYPEVMSSHRDNKNFMKYNLENTARLLGQLFPVKHIVVIRPARIEYKSFSCYDNFVPSNNAGVPDHTPTHNALHHLERLLQGVSSRIKSMPSSELIEAVSHMALPEDIDIEELQTHQIPPERLNTNGVEISAVEVCTTHEKEHKPDETLWWLDKLSLDNGGISLVGFSKGCVVLNQMIYEFHYTKTLTPGDDHMTRFISRISSMYWLDGGHAGGKNTWVTSRSLLETLTRLDVDIYIHVSPYQVQDEGRPWIGREERTFTQLLKKLGARVTRYMHDEGCSGPHSLNMHFEVLTNFKRLQDTEPPSLSDSSDEDT